MHFSDLDPMDLPAPQTIDELAAAFAVPLMTFVAQPSLTESSAGAVSSSSNGGPLTLDSVSVSYTLWRNPVDRDDPANLAELSESERLELDTPPSRPLPEWLTTTRALMRYPILWEAVMTTRMRRVEWQTPESTLVDHVNYVVTNTFRDQRVVGGFPGELDSPATERHIERIAVSVDGVDVHGMRIDTDPNVYAVGVDLGDRVLTAVVARDDLPHVTVAFATHPVPLVDAEPATR